MQRATILLAIMVITMAIPTEYDLRVQSSVVKYADFNLASEGLCAGYSWAKELAQIVSNAISLDQSERVALSAQQILDCT